VNGFNGETNEIVKQPVLKDVAADVKISPANFTLKPGQIRSVRVEISAPKDLSANERWAYSGYIVVEPKRSYADVIKNAPVQPTHSVPYGGLKGRMRTLNVMIINNDYPLLQSAFDDSKVEDGKNVFSMKANDYPKAVLRLAFSVRRLFVTVLEADSGRMLGMIPGGESHWLGRNDDQADNQTMELAWKGLYTVFQKGKPAPPVGPRLDSDNDNDDDDKNSEKPVLEVNNGKYKLRVQALRPFGNENRQLDYQVWESGSIVVDRTRKPPVEKPTDDDTDDGEKPKQGNQKKEREQRDAEGVMPKKIELSRVEL